MVTVSISEVYDLKTVTNKMSLIAIHTPNKSLIQKTYPGLAMNCKYFRIKSVDVNLVAVSTLPISPSEVGDDVDQIAPQDMLNPILYKAVSNDSWSTLEARLAGFYMSNTATPQLSGDMAECENDFVTGLSDEFGVYYSLLANRDGFKIAHPQSGLSMRGLKPLVFEKWYNHGENALVSSPDSGYDIVENTTTTPSTLSRTLCGARGMRGRPHPMPKINTTYLTAIDGGSGGFLQNGMSDGYPKNFQVDMPDIAPVMLGCIVLPPAKRTIMYYRMVCRAFIEFTDVRPIQEITSFGSMDTYYASEVYHSDYVTLSKNMDTKTDMVDVKDASIEKVMEGR